MECPCGVHFAQLRRPLLPSSLPRRPLPLLPKPSSLSFLSRAPFLAAASRRSPPPVRASIYPRGPATDEVLKGTLSVLLRPVSVALAMGVALFFARLHKPSLALALPAAESDTTPYLSPATDDSAPLTEEEKERALEEYLDSYPEDARALRALMRLKIQARKPAEAIAIVDRLVLLEPRDRGLPLLRAHMQSQGGDNEAAKQVFVEMLQRDPFLVEAYHGLVMAASQSEEPERELRGVLERIQGAVEVCKKERRKEELRDFKLLVAQVKVLQRDYGEALRVYQELVKEEPRDFRPYLCQGIIYAELGKKREAEKQFQKYRRLVPKGHPYAQYFDEDMVATNVFSQMGGSKRSAALKSQCHPFLSAMAALLFKGKKGVNHSYASPASTATSTSLEHLLSVDLQSTGELDRRAPRLRAQQQALGWVPPSLSKNKTHLQTSRSSWGRPGDPASPTASTRFLLDDDEADAFFDVFQELDSLPAWIPIDPDRFRSATGDDSAALKPSSSSSSSSSTITTTTAAAAAAAAAKERDQVLFGASSSSSYLPLSRLIQIEKGDGSPILRPSTAAPPPATLQTPKGGDSAAVEQSPFARSRKQAFFEASSSSSLQDRLHSVQDDNSTALKPSSSCSSSARSQDQVVVLKVSLHCKGCETKVRKHISRMKGVTSFDIDYATKKVTVIGDVTPLGVLSSVSKVKSAQFWSSLSQESTSSP